jgi:hypothetical protein
MMFRTALLVLILLAPMAAEAEKTSISGPAHRECMIMLQNGPAQEMFRKFQPLVETQEEWDRLVTVILEASHIVCLATLGVVDDRAEFNEMPWESPGMICSEREKL